MNNDLISAIVCEDVIGWSEGRHKLLVYSSDANFHVAGDGKLGGILEPNDMRCHTKIDPAKGDGLMYYTEGSLIIVEIILGRDDFLSIVTLVRFYYFCPYLQKCISFLCVSDQIFRTATVLKKYLVTYHTK